jgi:hypothetical protein
LAPRQTLEIEKLEEAIKQQTTTGMDSESESIVRRLEALR